MNIPPRVQASIKKKVASGQYRNSDEVLNKALRALNESEAVEAEIRRKIAIGEAELSRGEGIPGDRAFDIVRKAIRSSGNTKRA